MKEVLGIICAAEKGEQKHVCHLASVRFLAYSYVVIEPLLFHYSFINSLLLLFKVQTYI